MGFLGNNNPEALRETEVMRLLGKVDELAEMEEELVPSFIVGESITVIDGPFNSFSGIVEEINNDKRS